jgi:hypothetical protein
MLSLSSTNNNICNSADGAAGLPAGRFEFSNEATIVIIVGYLILIVGTTTVAVVGFKEQATARVP